MIDKPFFVPPVDADITHALDEELSYQNVEELADIQSAALAFLSERHFEVSA
jgi:hypothetical protein